MTLEIQLKLQAYCDGELPPSEVSAVEELLAKDEGARAQFAELSQTRKAVRGNELPAALTDTREFYWSQISRRIEAEANRAADRPRKPSTFLGWRQLLATFAGVTAVFVLIFNTSNHGPTPMAALADNVETSNDQLEATTYQDHQSNMTVVWLQAHPASFTTSSTDDSIQPQ